MITDSKHSGNVPWIRASCLTKRPVLLYPYAALVEAYQECWLLKGKHVRSNTIKLVIQVLIFADFRFSDTPKLLLLQWVLHFALYGARYSSCATTPSNTYTVADSTDRACLVCRSLFRLSASTSFLSVELSSFKIFSLTKITKRLPSQPHETNKGRSPVLTLARRPCVQALYMTSPD